MPLAMRPPAEVMHVRRRYPAEPPPALLEGTHDAIERKVENAFVGLGRDETVPHGSPARGGRGDEQAAYLGRDDDFARSAKLTEDLAKTPFSLKPKP